MKVENSQFKIFPGHRKNGGFSLVELLVSIAIFTIVTSIVVLSQGKFGSGIQVKNLAYDVALGIRQAQVYGVSVKSTPAGNFRTDYGVHFGPAGYYVLFADLDDSGSYKLTDNTESGCNPSSECVSMWKLKSGNSITRFCAGTVACTDGLGADKIDGMDIIFTRPNPEPIVKVNPPAGAVTIYSNASIRITSQGGINKTINVLPSGQVYVQ